MNFKTKTHTKPKPKFIQFEICEFEVINIIRHNKSKYHLKQVRKFNKFI